MPKILLVEDDPFISDLYVKKFSSAGFEIEVAASGRETLNVLLKEKFDLVLLDMVLPEMNGMDVLKELRKNSKYDPNIRVVVFSNLSQTETQQEALKEGADGFIGKNDHTPSELVELVSKTIRQFEEREKNTGKAFEPEAKQKNGKRILFIEDEEIFLEMFGKKLEDDGYEVVYAKNGAWGAKEAAKEKFDLVITDMMMPAMGGVEIIAKIRKEGHNSKVPIVVLSASVNEEDLTKTRELGISEFFLKTRIVPSDLSRKIGEILQ